jgi:hypothetical protein
MTRDELLDDVVKSVDSMRKVGLIKALGALALAVTCGLLYALRPVEDQMVLGGIGLLANRVVVALGVGFGLLAGLKMLREWRRSAGSCSPVYLALRDDPSRIVWVYEEKVHRGGVHYRTVVWFRFADGSAAPVSTAPRSEPFMAAVRSVCPHAAFGYSEEMAVRFGASSGSIG